jgi:drug/metabolite transporter (DMT)-like permease
MKKLLHLGLLISFQFGYLTWGTTRELFIFQGEYDILKKAVSSPANFIHPLILIPLCGQILLLITLFQTHPSRRLGLLGLSCMSLLILLLFFIGISLPNYTMIAYSLPFLLMAFFTVKSHWKQKNADGNL